MIIQTFPVGRLDCNCTIVIDEQSGDAIVIDGGDGVDDVMLRIEQHAARVRYLVHTHAHIDHICDLGDLRDRSGGSGLLHNGDLPLYATLPMQAQWVGMTRIPRVVKIDAELRDGDILRIGAIELCVLHTPGHTPGSCCFAVRENESPAILLTGDTLFAGAIGRWDLGGTSMEDIVHSIHTKLMDFNDATPVVPGHGPSTTIGTERRWNPYLTKAHN